MNYFRWPRFLSLGNRCFTCGPSVHGVTWFLLAAVLICMIGRSHASRNSHVFRFNPAAPNHGHFFNFLPKRFPIPASGPSRKHNEIGLQTWRLP